MWTTAVLLVAVCLMQRTCEANIISERPKSNTCRVNQLQCNSGSCFDRFLLCDGVKNCDDGTDESSNSCGNIPCSSEAFRCDYGACVEKSAFCDGVQQCADGSDEKPELCGCKLPPQPENGQYVNGGCRAPACKQVPGDIVHSTYLNYTCNRGFELSGSSILGCAGQWSGPFPKCVRVLCPALSDPSREIECKLNDTKVDCKKPMAPGTAAVIKCEFLYTNIREFSRFVSVCQPTGKWSRELSPCVPKCGERNLRRLPRVAGGSVARYGEFPWHVGLYRQINGNFLNICGGTIISERSVVTAAHCFWDVEAKKQFNINNFQVAAGKYYSNWNNDDKRYVQKRKIERVVLHNKFGEEKNNWAHDIALILLKDTFEMTIAVRPICLDNENKYERFFSPGKMGTVLGWGITETMQHSDELRMATLKYVSMADCEKEVPNSFLPFLTLDRFCAGYRNGTTLCPGDDGGGFAFQVTNDEKWYLMGIASMGASRDASADCDVKNYVTFTKVSNYLEFLESIESK